MKKIQSKMEENFQKQYESVKQDLEKIKQKILDTYPEKIAAIALLPKKPSYMLSQALPQNIPPAEQENKKTLLVLVQDVDEKNLNRYQLADKISDEADKIAESINKDIQCQVMLISELKEDCYDAKYEILVLISSSIILYDPVELLAAVRVSEIHKAMVLKRFDKYIVSYVAAGSLFRGDKKSNDIDVYIVVDDTDVKKMSRFELKEKLRGIILMQGQDAAKIAGVEKQFHIQTYILTDFWESVKDANPVIFTFLRDGVPLYDRGVFMSWKLLLSMGRIRPSPEAIDLQMDLGNKLLSRTKMKLLSIVGEDLYYAMLNPAQAALMLYGVAPPTPQETIDSLRTIFVKKEKLLEEKYVKELELIRKYYKDIEHGKMLEISGAEIDSLLKSAQDYFARIQKLFSEIEKKRAKENINNSKQVIESLVKELAQKDKITFTSLMPTYLKIAEKEKIPKHFENILNETKKLDDKKLSKQERDKILRESHELVRLLDDIIQRKLLLELQKLKLLIKHKDKTSEVIFTDTNAYFIMDLEKKEEIKKAKFHNDIISSLEPSKLEEFEEALKKAKRITLNSKLMDSLKKIYGDFEILI